MRRPLSLRDGIQEDNINVSFIRKPIRVDDLVKKVNEMVVVN